MKMAIYVKPLPWCSKQFSEFVTCLDIQTISRQSKKCLVGEPSACVRPTIDVPDCFFFFWQVIYF